MENLRKYIGIPFLDKGRSFEGMDCLGLVIQVYKDVLGLHIPDVEEGYDSAYAQGQVQTYIKEYAHFSRVREIEIPHMRKLDVLVFRIRGYERHVALNLGNNEMLHLMEGSHSVVERFDTIKWQRILARVLRYE